jgi:NTP pyrophosphatase (non-canonical NTP hydrolase)
MNDRETTVEELQDVMRQFVSERNWQKFHTPKNLAMSLTIEAGEVLELFQWLTPEESIAKANDPEAKAAVGDELSDVLAYLLSLSQSMGIDLAAAFESKMKRVRIKYPAEA